jgi:thioredoxin-related protein
MKLPDWRTQLDVTANVAVIGTCLILCIILLVQFVDVRRATQAALDAQPPVLAAGTILESVKELTFSGSELTVLVGLSSTCRYCDESMPAFRRLNERVRSQQPDRVRVFAIAAQARETLTEYLWKNSLTAFQPIKLEQGSKLGPLVRRTPSVVLVNRQGTVLASWPGLMTTTRLVEVIEHLDGKSARR